MKRRNAILLGSVFLLVMAGYVAWCWRPFYSHIAIEYPRDIPPDAVAEIEKWRKEYPLWQPEPFELVFAIRLLANPWDYHREACVYRSKGREKKDVLVVSEKGACLSDACFAQVDGKWTRDFPR
jgi:hypothetical protein